MPYKKLQMVNYFGFYITTLVCLLLVSLIQERSFAIQDAGSLLKDQQDLQKLNENNSSSVEENRILFKEFVFKNLNIIQSKNQF